MNLFLFKVYNKKVETIFYKMSSDIFFIWLQKTKTDISKIISDVNRLHR